MTIDTKTEPKMSRQVVTTDELMELLAAGKTVQLPEVVRPVDSVLEHYETQETTRLDVATADNPVVSVKYVGEEEVQCISVADERHLYITDDFIPTHNTSNIVFLKSTDDSMIETLQKMSGTTHRTRTDSKQITRDLSKLTFKNEGKISYTKSTKEEPVISYNDLAYLDPRNSIVFRAGDPPIWNRNETILPMSWKLFSNTIEKPGADFTLQSIPTMSTAKDFDVKTNQPNFFSMVEKRIDQAVRAEKAEQIFRSSYGYSEYDFTKLDPNNAALEIMDIVDAMGSKENFTPHDPDAEAFDLDDAEFGYSEYDMDDAADMFISSSSTDKADDTSYAGGVDSYDTSSEKMVSSASDNTDMLDAQHASQQYIDAAKKVTYADGRVSQYDLIDPGIIARRGEVYAIDGVYEEEFITAFKESQQAFASSDNGEFSLEEDGSLVHHCRNGREVFIRALDKTEVLERMKKAAKDDTTQVYADGDQDVDLSDLDKFATTHAFRQWLVEHKSWSGIADGRFELEFKRVYDARENQEMDKG